MFVRPVPFPVACAAMLALTGCVDSDVAIHRVADASVEAGGDGGVLPAQDDGARPDGGPSPWDGLDGLEVPDQHFFAAWRSLSTYERRFDLVDVLGRSVMAFDHPGWAGEHDGLDESDFELVDVRPGADGTAWILEEPLTYTAWGSDWVRWVWRADATTGETEHVLLSNWEGELYLPGIDRIVPTGESGGTLRIAPDPVDADVLWVAVSDIGYYYYGHDSAGSVLRIDVADPDAEVLSWALADILPDRAVDEPHHLVSLWEFSATLSGDDGSVVLALGTDGLFPEAGADLALKDLPRQWGRRLSTFGPLEETATEHLDLTDQDFVKARVPDVIPSRGELSAVLQHHPSWYGGPPCGTAPIRVVDAVGTLDVTPTVDQLLCFGATTLLDASAPTFVYVADRAGGPYQYESSVGSVVGFSHRGEDVHHLDRFTVGLTPHAFALQQLVLVRP